jgi:hypothetical protein
MSAVATQSAPEKDAPGGDVNGGAALVPSGYAGAQTVWSVLESASMVGSSVLGGAILAGSVMPVALAILVGGLAGALVFWLTKAHSR